MPKKGIKESANGITVKKYYDALVADFERKAKSFDYIKEGELQQGPVFPDEIETQIKYASLSDEQLKEEYDKLLADNPVLWEYSYSAGELSYKGAGSLPKWVRNTGNTAELTKYLEDNEDKLSYEQQYLIKQRIAATEKKLMLQQEAKNKSAQGENVYTEPVVNTKQLQGGDEAIELTGVHQTQKQNSNAGCWSVFLANAAGSRGVDLTQKDIRSYRPELSAGEAENVSLITDSSYNSDEINNALERGDGLLTFMPGFMMTEMEIPKYSDEQVSNGVSVADFEKNAVEHLKTTIKHALKNDKSPVGLLKQGHYLTIVGIEGDTIKYKDSLGYDSDPDHTYEDSLTAIATGILNDPDVYGVQLTWIKEVQLSKDGRTIFGVPSDYARMNPDGTVLGQPGPVRLGGGYPEDGFDIHKEGVAVARYGGVEDTKPEQNYRPVLQNGIIISEKVYLPKTLDTDYLKGKAEVRSDEDERKLREADNAYYHLNRPLQPVMEDPGIPDYEAGMKAAENRFKTELGESWKKALENGFDFIKTGGKVFFENLSFVTADPFDIAKISAEDRQNVKNYLNDFFGEDARGTFVMDADNILQRFTYRKSPDSDPVNIWDEVKATLRAIPGFEDVKDVEIKSYVRPVIIRAMMDRDALLTFENGDLSVRNIYVNNEELDFPEENMGENFLPGAYKEEELFNPFEEQVDYSKAEDEAEDKTENKADEKKESEIIKTENDQAPNIEPDNKVDEKNEPQDKESQDKESQIKEEYKIPDIKDYDIDALLKSFVVIENNEPKEDENSFPQGEAVDDLPLVPTDKAKAPNNTPAQENPFRNVPAFDIESGPYSEDAEALQINPFDDVDYADMKHYEEAARTNYMLFKDPESEETYAAQKNTREKIWYTSFYLAKEYALKDTGASYTDAEERKKSEILTDAITDKESLKKAIETLAEIESQAAVDIGREAGNIEKRLHYNGDPEIAADYLVKEGSSKGIQFGKASAELEFLMRERFNELKESDPDAYGAFDFDEELEASRGRYIANRIKDTDKAFYERGKKINDSEEIARPNGIIPPIKSSKNVTDYDRVLHAKKSMSVALVDSISDIIDKGRGFDTVPDFDNDFYKELDAYRNLKTGADKIKKVILADKTFAANNRLAFSVFDELSSELNSYYKKDERTGKYPEFNNYAADTLRHKYTNAINRIKILRDEYAVFMNGKYEAANKSKRVTANDVKAFNDVLKLLASDLKVVDKIFKSRQTMTLPLGAFKYSEEIEKINYVNGTFKYPGFMEFCRIYAGTGRATEDILKEFTQETPAHIRIRYEKEMLVNPSMSEYLPEDSKIPGRIENTSDPDAISEYLKRNDLLLTEREKAHLQNHYNSAVFAKNLNDIADTYFGNLNNYYDEKRRPEVVIKGEDAAELDVHQTEFQTSLNGGWSVAGALMINSFGGQRPVRQEDIRYYRPELSEGEVLDRNGMMNDIYSRDNGRDLMDMGDSILRYAPDKMMRQFEIAPYDEAIEKKGISPDEYLANAMKLFKKQVLHTLKYDRCPIPFKMGSHYITITGIEGDIIKYKDSRRNGRAGETANPDHTFVVSVKDLIGKRLTGSKAERSTIQLTWLSDIKLSKDKQSIFGVPSKYATVDDDGEIYTAPMEYNKMAEQDNTVANRNGIRFYRFGGDEENNKDDVKDKYPLTDGGIIKLEKAYLPKKVHIKYLVNEAEKREEAEEKRLNNDDMEMLGIDRDIAYTYSKAMEVDETAKTEGDILDLPNVPDYDLGDGDEKGNGSDNPDTGRGSSDAGEGRKKSPESITQDNMLAVYRNINLVSKDLLNKLDKSTPWYINGFTDMFRITDTSVDFDEIKEGLEEMVELSEGVIGASKEISEKDAQDIVKKLTKTIDATREYLNGKAKQFMADSSRKNSKSKAGTEQARIRAAIDSFKEISNLKVEFTGAAGNKSSAFKDIEKKKVSDTVKDFEELLVTNLNKDMQKKQDESFRNRTEIPERHMKRLVRLEAAFGKKPEFIEDFQDKGCIKYIEVTKNGKTEKVSSFTKLTEIKDEFKGIGPSGANTKLSDKDFVAIAVAESTTAEVFRPEYEKLRKHKAFEGMTLEEVASNYSAHIFDAYSAEILDKLTDTIPFVEAARQKAVKDIKAYENGDKKPLATVIANNLNFLVLKWKANNHALLDSGSEYLFNSEIGQRMFGMLERDPDLMKLAKNAGLNPEVYFNLKAMEREGKAKLKGFDLLHAAMGVQTTHKELANDKLWQDQDVKEERFADMLLNEAHNIEGHKSEARKDAIKEIKEARDKADNEYNEKRMVAQCRKALAVLRTYKDRDDFKKIYDKFKKECDKYGVKDTELTEDNDNFLNITYEFSIDTEVYISKIANDLHSLKLELYNYYRGEVLQIEEKARLEGKIVCYGDEGTLRYAETEAKKYIISSESRISKGEKLSPEEDVKYKYLKDLMDRYARLGKDSKDMGRLERQKQDECSYIKIRSLLDDNIFKMKYIDQNQISERLNVIGESDDLKERLKAFMRYKGLDKLSPAEFAKKLNNRAFSKDIMHDMLQFERDKAAGKIEYNEPGIIHIPEEKAPEEKAPEVNADNERVRISVDELENPVKAHADADKITANDILDVKIELDNKKAPGADSEKLRTSYENLQEEDGVKKEDGITTAEKNKTKQKKVLLTI